MTFFFRSLVGAAIAFSATVPLLCAAQVPKVQIIDGASQLILDGKPYLIFGGELGNSSAGTAAQADSILPKLAGMHVNTVLMPVSWEEIEPVEGQFDFSILDHWLTVARQQHLHLVLLWFGAWKNAFSGYAPGWVKSNTERFPRAIAADGLPTEILSTLGADTLRADSLAFAALLKHLRDEDSEQQTVLMVQVENEVGFLGLGGRDRSAEANRLFQAAVPIPLIHDLAAKRCSLSPELMAHFNPHGTTWSEVFGDAADEVFMAWHYATYIQAVASAGKRAYPLPMYVNTQLPAPLERAGQYPSGGPNPYYLDVYRFAAPALDFFSPDIYWPDFEYWLKRYELAGNAIFVPEARGGSGPYNALYTYGAARAFGFSPFSIENLPVLTGANSAEPATMMETYAALNDLGDMLPLAQQQDKTRGLVLHASSLRPTQTVALGGYLFDATLARSWPAHALTTQDGAMLILQTAPDEFYVVGSGLHVTILRDPDTDGRIAGIVSIDEVSRDAGRWVIDQRLTGDESDQGRQLLMDPHRVHTYHVRLYSYPRVVSEAVSHNPPMERQARP